MIIESLFNLLKTFLNNKLINNKNLIIKIKVKNNNSFFKINLKII